MHEDVVWRWRYKLSERLDKIVLPIISSPPQLASSSRDCAAQPLVSPDWLRSAILDTAAYPPYGRMRLSSFVVIRRIKCSTDDQVSAHLINY
jgi:hypothetical protein